MATGKNRKNAPTKGQKPLAPNRYQNNDAEYDVSNSLRKVRPYNKRSSTSETTTGQYAEERQRAYVQSLEDNSNQTQGIPTWERYDRLEDKISSYSDKNEADHNNLRKELEGKIDNAKKELKSEVKEVREGLDKKLSKQWYTWTIGGLAVFVSVIFALSYSKVISFVDDGEKRIIRLEIKIDQLLQPQAQNDTIK